MRWLLWLSPRHKLTNGTEPLEPSHCLSDTVVLAQLMGHDSLDTTLLYIRGTEQDLQLDVEKIAWM